MTSNMYKVAAYMAATGMHKSAGIAEILASPEVIGGGLGALACGGLGAMIGGGQHWGKGMALGALGGAGIGAGVGYGKRLYDQRSELASMVLAQEAEAEQRAKVHAKTIADLKRQHEKELRQATYPWTYQSAAEDEATLENIHDDLNPEEYGNSGSSIVPVDSENYPQSTP